MQGLPLAVLVVIESKPGFWSGHAAESKDRLGLEWVDVVEVARSSECVRPEKDDEAVNALKYVMVGRDLRDRRLYTVGKVVWYDDEEYWKVITIHEAD